MAIIPSTARGYVQRMYQTKDGEWVALVALTKPAIHVTISIDPIQTHAGMMVELIRKGRQWIRA